MTLEIAIVSIGLLAAPVAPAQSTRPDEPPQGLLAGPTVEDGAETQDESAGVPFGGSNRGRRETFPIRRWLAVYRGIELDDEQQVVAQRHIKGFQDARRAYDAEYGEQLRSLRTTIRKARRENRDPDVETMRTVQQIREVAPDPAQLQTTLWTLLTFEQQDVFRDALAAERARAEERQQAARRRRAQEQPAEPGLDDASRRRLRFLRSLQPPGSGDREADGEGDTQADDE